jgi:septation ring formation regulator EzrA
MSLVPRHGQSLDSTRDEIADLEQNIAELESDLDYFAEAGASESFSSTKAEIQRIRDLISLLEGDVDYFRLKLN